MVAQILVLEEDNRQFEQIKQCLQTNGHKAWRAFTIAEAFEFLRKYGMDLVLSAVNLENSDVFKVLHGVTNGEQQKNLAFVFYCTDKERCDRYATSGIMAAGKALGARKYILLSGFDANRFWAELEDCIPQNAQKNDSLGSQITTYSLSDFSWTDPPRKAAS